METERGRSKRRRTSSRSRSRSRSYSRASLYKPKGYLTPGFRKPIRLYPDSTIRLPDGRFPASINTVMNHVTNVNHTNTGGALATYVFRANSLYDPNETGGGHQPYLFDQYMALYTTYVVYGAYFEITFSSATTAPIFCVLTPSLSNAASTSSVTDAEKGESVSGILNQAGSQPGPLVLKKYVDIGRAFGSTKGQILFDIAWQGTSTGNPSTLAYLKATTRPVDASTTALVYMNVKIKYYVTFRQRIEQTQS